MFCLKRIVNAEHPYMPSLLGSLLTRTYAITLNIQLRQIRPPPHTGLFHQALVDTLDIQRQPLLIVRQVLVIVQTNFLLHLFE